MRTLGWALTALGVFLAAFVAMWIVDASVPHAYNLTDPQIWLGAAILGALALAGIARIRQAETRTVLQGVAAGALGAAVAIGAVYILFFANLGGGYSPQLTASVPVNGTWDNQTAIDALEAKGLDAETTGWGSVSATGSPDGRFDVRAFTSPASTEQANATRDAIELRVSYSPQRWFESNEAAGAWIEENRDRIEQRFDAFLDAFLAETGWEQAGNVTWRNETAVG